MPKNAPDARSTYRQRKPKKKKIVIADEGYKGSIKNHPTHPEPEAYWKFNFRGSDGKIAAFMDPVFEELYWIVKDTPNTHEIFSNSCKDNNVPYIDGNPDFQIAIPIKFYTQWAKDAGAIECHDHMLMIEQILMEKWEKFKNNGF